jgi:uncharacterized protein
MNVAMTLKNDKRPWYKEPWPWILMAGPGVVIVAGVITTVIAVQTSDGLVSDDYYKQGLSVNQRMQRDQHATQMGLHADVMRSGLNLRLLITAADSSVLPPAITLRFAHPTVDGRDQVIQMTSEGQGFYAGVLNAGLVGRWHVTLEDPAGQWRLQGDWKTDSDDPLRLNARVK